MTGRDVGVPEIQTYKVDVPGRNGTLDLSEFLTGDIRYSNRTLKFSFYMKGKQEQLLNSINEMMMFHGQKVKIILDDCLNYYFIGRATITYNDYKHYIEFEMSVDAEPFRIAKEKSSFSFKISSSKECLILNNGIAIIPTVITTAEVAITKNGQRVSISAGSFYMDKFFKLEHGENTFTIEGNATVTFEFTEEKI